jgi:hypothetical protein
MAKKILGVVAGLAAWVAIVMAAGAIMRLTWPAYASVADAMTFTLAMMMVRLAIGFLATMAAGLITAVVVPRSTVTTLMTGVLLLVAFIPQHISLWDKFPIWYHLTFLLSLVPLTYVGGMSWIRWRGEREMHPGRQIAQSS